MGRRKKERRQLQHSEASECSTQPRHTTNGKKHRRALRRFEAEKYRNHIHEWVHGLLLDVSERMEARIAEEARQEDDFMFKKEGDVQRRLEEVQYIAMITNGFAEKLDITARMREVLVEWIFDVCHKFSLESHTFHLTISLVDAYISKHFRTLQRSRLQLVGLASMLIASKVEEIYPPTLKYLVYISAKAFSRDDIIKMESIVLNDLNFDVAQRITPMSFITDFCKAASITKDRTEYALRCMLDISTVFIDFLSYTPSIIAASATILALQTENRRERPEALMTCARIRDDDFTKLDACIALFKQKIGNIKGGNSKPIAALSRVYSSPVRHYALAVVMSDCC